MSAPSGRQEYRRTSVMSGSMRKIGEYLGLLEDTGRYDDE